MGHCIDHQLAHQQPGHVEDRVETPPGEHPLGVVSRLRRTPQVCRKRCPILHYCSPAMSDAAEPSSDDCTVMSGGHARFRIEPGDPYVVHVAGELDADSINELRPLLDDAFRAAPSAIVVELAELDFVDSMGLGMLVTSHNRASDIGIGFEIHHLPESCRRVFEITNLLDVLDLR
jgi:anti-sigma B factor antagonist